MTDGLFQVAAVVVAVWCSCNGDTCRLAGAEAWSLRERSGFRLAFYLIVGKFLVVGRRGISFGIWTLATEAPFSL